jgi:GNAT superfamily N-acetyltransferase
LRLAHREMEDSLMELLWISRDDEMWHGAQELFKMFVDEAAVEIAEYRGHRGKLLGEGEILVALSADRRPIGALGVSERHDCRYAVLAWVYVDTEHRGAGVGRALVRGMVERFGSEIGFDVDPPPTDGGKALMSGCPDVQWREYENKYLNASKARQAKRRTR